jgi:phosphoglycolate phosphatase
VARLFLWDIDETLVTCRSLQLEVWQAAAAAIDLPTEQLTIDFEGKTDPDIARNIAEALSVDDSEMEVHVKRLLRALGPQLASRRNRIASDGAIMDGVREILAAIDETNAVNTVLTGNVAVNAICKLDAFRLTQYFDLEVGAYGSDKPALSDLFDIAVNRVAEKRNKYFEDEDIWVIGSSPQHHEIAVQKNVKCLLVSTGNSTAIELEALQPDALLPDLRDTAHVMSILMN